MKNPFMSMWLSGANKVANTIRGKALAESRRALKAATKKSSTAAKPKKRSR